MKKTQLFQIILISLLIFSPLVAYSLTRYTFYENLCIRPIDNEKKLTISNYFLKEGENIVYSKSNHINLEINKLEEDICKDNTLQNINKDLLIPIFYWILNLILIIFLLIRVYKEAHKNERSN